MNENEIGLFEAIYTQRSIRRFKTDPLPRAVIGRIIESATKAPNGGNRQPWGFVVVETGEVKAALAPFVRQGYVMLLERERSRGSQQMAMYESAHSMIDDFEDIPVLVFACLVRAEGQPEGSGQGSLFPAIQNLLLAARGLGVGAVMTAGFTQPFWPEVRQILKLPANVNPVSMIPLGYPDRQRYGPTTRRPWTEVTHWEHWGNYKSD